MRIGVNVSTASTTDPVAAAVAAERLGYDFVSASDHPAGTAPTFETWTMLTWIAAATSRIAVLPRVLAVPLRRPPLVAKMAETLDRLSDGRLILGLGGGYSDAEFRAFGLPPLTPGQKVDGLADAVRITRGLWTERAFSHAGRVHSTDAADIEPKPAHPIPIWLGTFGPRALAVTGRLADGWIPSLGHADADALVGMRERVRAAARDAGRDPDAVSCILNVTVGVDQPTEDPAALTGSADEIADRLLGFARAGFVGFNVLPVGPDPADQVERIAAEVLPAVRAG